MTKGVLYCECRHTPYSTLFAYKGEEMAEKNNGTIDFFERKNKNFTTFERLCDRAKNIFFNALENEITMKYLLVSSFPEEIAYLSPIEQIFYVAKEIFGIISCNDLNFEIYFNYQEYVKAKDKTYRADFYIDTVSYKNKTYRLKTPILIELDGQKYHSTKEQRNRDYERENNLKLEGYHILRFTGSQVYKEPIRCVRKVYDYSLDIIEKEGFR